jgi:elongation factor Ts
MAEITAALVKELREKTSAGMMDCKKALTECDGDLEAAVDWLRKKGLSAAAKKAGRTAAEGLVGAATGDASGAVVEVNSETDFVARNEGFQSFVAKLTELALAVGDDMNDLKAAAYPGGSGTVADQLTDMVAKIGENMSLRRVKRLQVGSGVVSSYVHNAVVPGLGKIAVLVALESQGDRGELESLGKQLAMHVAAANPLAIDRDGVDPSDLERERKVLMEQAMASGKPEEIAQKMAEGRMRKFYEENCLLEQVFVVDGKSKVADVVADKAKELGSDITVSAFVRYQLGEGIERKSEDFAAEVAAQLG